MINIISQLLVPSHSAFSGSWYFSFYVLPCSFDVTGMVVQLYVHESSSKSSLLDFGSAHPGDCHIPSHSQNTWWYRVWLLFFRIHL